MNVSDPDLMRDTIIEFRMAGAPRRRWQLDLLNSAAMKPGIRVRVGWVRDQGRSLRGLSALFAVERIVEGIPKHHPAADVNPDAFERYAADGAEAPDHVIDFCGPIEKRSVSTWFVEFGGGFGEAGATGALLEGGLPLIRIVDGASGDVVAIARPGEDARSSLQVAFAHFLEQAVVLVNAAIDGCRPKADTSEAMNQATEPTLRHVGLCTAKILVRKSRQLIYHALCNAPHWRVGWRFTSGADIFDHLDLPPVPWNTLEDDGTHFYADPFPMVYRQRTFLFVEDYDHHVGRGVISAVEFDDSGPRGLPTPVLSLDSHLSYPFIFEADGEIWMVPESAATNTIDLYRSISFPDEWVHERTLISGVAASDSTLFEVNGRWWMMATVRGEGASYSDSLFLWWAETLRGPWVAHRKNPVLIDIASARPAGRVVRRNGRLLRPVQDCCQGYGAALALAEVTRLDVDGFEQRVLARLRPGPHWAGRRLHTVNRAGRLECIDGSGTSFRVGHRTLKRWVEA